MSLTLTQKILDATDKGLLIFKEELPDVNWSEIENSKFRKKFKIRPESTPSASIKLLKDKYIIADFGESQDGYNAIAFYANQHNIDYPEALFRLAKKLGLTGKPAEPNKTFKKAGKKDKVGTTFIYKEKIPQDWLKFIGPYVNELVAAEVNLKAVDSYTVVSEKGNKIIIKSTDDYPIFVLDQGAWQKKYEPFASKAADRFRYIGGRPQDYLFGYDYCLDLKEDHESQVINDFDERGETPTKHDLKLPFIVLASGDRDGINMLSLDFPAVWLNSESADLTDFIYNKLTKIAKEVIYLGDLDDTGKKQAINKGLERENLKLMWLPSWVGLSKNFRGKFRKDFTDFIQIHKVSKDQFKKEVKALIETSKPLRFWDEVYNPKKKQLTYKFNNAYAFHFLECLNFYLYEDQQSKEDFEFIQIEDNRVKKVKAHQIKKFLLDHLTKNNKPIDLVNMLLRTNQLNDKSLSQLKPKQLNFDKATPDSQFFFFQDQTWQITKDGINKLKPGASNTYVWQNNVIDFSPKINEAQFNIKGSIETGFDIDILETNNKYLNYLINTSRVYWREDLEAPFKTDKGFNKADKDAYFKANQFNIAGKHLTPEQIQEQKQHLINKIYAIGYLLHSYKLKNKAWAVWVMDNKVVEDIESNGGTGKSVFGDLLTPVLNQIKEIDGRVKGIIDKDFVFDGVKDSTDLIFVDDADPYFNIERLYKVIQGNINVNPKGSTEYVVHFDKSPKILITSNFGITNSHGSTLRRLLFVAMSDYYHEKGTKYNETRKVSDDFNGKLLIDDFTAEDWQLYYNFLAQCITFYLNQNQKINPPLENVEKRNLIREIKGPFISWADTYFSEASENLNREIIKKDAITDFKESAGYSKFSSQKFKDSLTKYCQLKGYELNPADHERVNSDGRIMQKHGGKVVEFIVIRANKEATVNINTEQPKLQPLDDNDKDDDLPF